jgi:DNA (cytosine-5)-methyltransferase 1
LQSTIKKIFLELLDKIGHSKQADNSTLYESLVKYTQNNLQNWEANIEQKDGAVQVLDFFSGCGGMSSGFAALSKEIPFFEVIGACDIHSDALRSFEKNYNAPGVNCDIRTLLSDSKLSEFMNKISKRDETKPLVLIGCAPCQGFSSHRKKDWYREDERNSLVGVFAEIAVKLNPEIIVIENVPELLGKKYWENFKEAYDIFTDAGYIVKQSIYNTATFGVPQERFRAIVIAQKKDFHLPPHILNDNEFMTVKDAIGDLPYVDAGVAHESDALHRSAHHRTSTLDTIKAVPKNGGNRPVGVGPKCLDKVKGYTDVYGRLDWNKPAITITHYARNPASGRFTHPEQDRGLTTREALRLQSFPDNYCFEGSFDSIFKQIGEAVPPKLSCVIAASILLDMVGMNDVKSSSVSIVKSPVSSSYSSVIAGIKMTRKANVCSRV